MRKHPYPSDLTDAQWATLEPLIPRPARVGRPRPADMREIVNAMFYITREGCTWRALPRDFPPWKKVYYYFHWWNLEGHWQAVVDHLREAVRLRYDREPTPSACAIDGKSVPTSEGGAATGTDGGKKVNGRKRHILVDAMGLLVAVVVTAANVDDARAAQDVFARVRPIDFPRLAVVFADNKYHNHELYEWLWKNPKPFRLEVVSKPEGQKGFTPLPVRWVVERTFAWHGRYRRLSVDREHLPESEEAFVRAASVHHMLHRLCPEFGPPSSVFRFEGHTRKRAA